MPHYSIRNTITHIDGLIFKDQLLSVPKSLRKEIMQQAHAVHGGIRACRRRLRDIAYWPGINNDIENYIKTCPSCIKHSEIQNKKEPLLQHARGETPWSKIGIELCQLDNRILIIVIDYYSNFLSVEKLSITTSNEVIKTLLKMFAIHGIQQEIVTDNGLQFRNVFRNFTQQLDIKHITTSPYHSQGNGKAENAVNTTKRIFKKCNGSEQLAILEHNNTTIE